VRISGALASLVGLELAIESGDEARIQQSIDIILLLHSMIMSFGGIPLLYYGDEVGTLNDRSFMQDERKAQDTRWMHRPRIDWNKVARRTQHGSVEQRIFDGLQRMIAVRKGIPAFADFNNRELLDTGNPHLFVFMRQPPMMGSGKVLVVGNFDSSPQSLTLSDLGNRGHFEYSQLKDLCSGEVPRMFKNQLVVPPHHFYWLSDEQPG
jgi:amylosucrase